MAKNILNSESSKTKETFRHALNLDQEDFLTPASKHVWQPSPVCSTRSHGKSSFQSFQCFHTWVFHSLNQKKCKLLKLKLALLKIPSFSLHLKTLGQGSAHASAFSFGMVPVKSKGRFSHGYHGLVREKKM